ncbi:MOSC domain-containing protein [Wenyingzhuangia sp. IMCC45574]
MKIIATNIAKPVTFLWNDEQVTTGIYKQPTSQPLFLTKDYVVKDEISDRIHHGGHYKACYIFSAEHYSYWKELYPNLEWTWGMFGENLTVEGFHEKEVCVGDIYKVGEALVQVAQYREPCFKLGYKFGSQKVLKQFIKHGYPGTYLSILKEGNVKTGDEFVLLERPENNLSVHDLFKQRFAKEKEIAKVKIAANCLFISHKERAVFKSFLENSK